MTNINNEAFNQYERHLNELKNSTIAQEKLDGILTYLIEINSLLKNYATLITGFVKNQEMIAQFQSVTNDTIGKLNDSITGNSEIIEIHGQHFDAISKHIDIHSQYLETHDKHLEILSSRIDQIDG